LKTSKRTGKPEGKVSRIQARLADRETSHCRIADYQREDRTNTSGDRTFRTKVGSGKGRALTLRDSARVRKENVRRRTPYEGTASPRRHLLKEEVDAEEIAQIVSRWTHIQSRNFWKARPETFAHEDRLRERVRWAGRRLKASQCPTPRAGWSARFESPAWLFYLPRTYWCGPKRTGARLRVDNQPIAALRQQCSNCRSWMSTT